MLENLLPYTTTAANKTLVKSVAQPILLANDKLVRRFCQRGKNSCIEDTVNRIDVHEEYKLTESQWNYKAQEYVNYFKPSIEQRSKTTIVSSSNLTLSTVVAVATMMIRVDRRKRGGGKATAAEKTKRRATKRKKEKNETTTKTNTTTTTTTTTFISPYKAKLNPLTGQRYDVVTLDQHHFSKMYEKSQMCVSRQILLGLFPTQVNNKTKQLLNDIKVSGMMENPNY